MTNTLSDYPQTAQLPGGQAIQLKSLTEADRDAILAFAAGLPEEDLLFLVIDLTQPAAVDGWIETVTDGQSVTLLAYDGDVLIGYATVHREPARWLRRVGEIRVNIAPGLRGKGLGRLLISRIFDVARGLSLTKLLARMTVEQKDAQAAFSKLGFVAEALLADFVEDRNGVAHDLVMMTFDVDGLTDQAGAPVKL